MKNKEVQHPYKTVCRNCGTVGSMAKNDLDLSHLQCHHCKKVGTTGYIKRRSKAMSKRKQQVLSWKQDDKVIVDFNGEPYTGSIAELTKTKAKVLFDDGDVLDVKLKDLKAAEPEQLSETKEHKVNSKIGFTSHGFHQYEVKWDKTGVNFKFKAEESEFFGWWRKVQVKDSSKIVYGVDLLVDYKGHRYNIETLPYVNEDPRDDLQSLNADICAAANKWFYHKCQGTFDTIDALQQRAAKPTIKIFHLETLDNIIIKLKEYRNTSIRSGGVRVMMFTGDEPEKGPSMRIQMDLTTQAMGLKGRIPSLTEGATLDRVAEDPRKEVKGRGKPIEVIPDSKNVQDLVKRLKTSKDKTEQRKIRAALRRMGHKGGTRKDSK